MQQSTFQTGTNSVNNKTLNSVANVPKHKKNKLITEANQMLGATRKCKEMWREIRKADFRKTGILNETNIRLLFEKCGGYIYDLLKLNDPSEIISVFDTGSDCQLNEDEQVLIFQVIKQKMYLFAEECCKIQEYSLYKDLMREVRLLEAEICEMQNELRQSIQTSQMQEYDSIGQDQLRDFYKTWELRFQQFEQESLRKAHNLQHEHEEQMEALNMKLDRAVENAKIKPAAKLKDYQLAEKMVAVNERIEEAQNYRNELRKFEVQEAQRVEKLKEQNANNQRRHLLKTQKKDMEMLEIKIETARHNLKIEMDHHKVVLSKQINLHVSDILRMQGYVKKLAIDKGKVRDELLRAKVRSRKTMDALKQSKAIEEKNQEGTVHSKTISSTLNQPFAEGGPVDVLLFGSKNKGGGMASTFGSNDTESQSNTQQTIDGLRNIIKECDITRFNISNSAPDGSKLYTIANAKNLGGFSKMPINAVLQTKVQILLDQRKPPSEELPSLVTLYDEELNDLN